MKCTICGCEESKIIYDDYIRDGAPGTLTEEKYQMYQCSGCHTIWHKINKQENANYYQSKDYREKLENSKEIENYWTLHDKEVLAKFEYTGTDIFRNAVVADIGCGGGSFLDFIFGAAAEIVAIEPSKIYREKLQEKGYHTYPYAADAKPDYKERCDVVTSFDVIEHVDDPAAFMADVYDLLKRGGRAIIGTPTDCPVMRRLMGHEYEQKLLYSFQHPWILSPRGFEICCKKAGFANVRIEQKQRYGLSNALYWLKERKPGGDRQLDFISDSLDNIWKTELNARGMADYIVAYIQKD